MSDPENIPVNLEISNSGSIKRLLKRNQKEHNKIKKLIKKIYSAINKINTINLKTKKILNGEKNVQPGKNNYIEF